MSAEILERILHPRSVAVAGASPNAWSWGYAYLHHLVDYGFRGRIYPVNPRYQEVMGFTAYATVRDIPGPVDYAISCVPSAQVMNLLEDCAEKGVGAIHLYTARFSETGRRDAADLEQEILRKARRAGIRLIGPNCMGVYHPGHGLSFGYGLAREAGPVGMASQTGGGASWFVRMGGKRGLRFSKVISYGNALDFNECDYLEYLAQDEDTKIITVYVEGVRNGQRFFRTLRQAAERKPTIVVKGGRSRAGTRAVASHTASLAGSMDAWEAMMTQAGAVPAANFDEMADLAVAFHFLPAIPGPRVGVAGGGGGPSVLSADECEEAGLEVVPLPDSVRRDLKDRGVEIWDWISNPVDVSIIGGFGVSDMDMLRLMGESDQFDLLIGLVNEGVMFTLSQREGATRRLQGVVEGYSALQKECRKPLLAVLGDDGSGRDEFGDWAGQIVSETRSNLIEAGIPFFPTIERAASAARKVIDYHSHRQP